MKIVRVRRNGNVKDKTAELSNFDGAFNMGSYQSKVQSKVASKQFVNALSAVVVLSNPFTCLHTCRPRLTPHINCACQIDNLLRMERTFGRFS